WVTPCSSMDSGYTVIYSGKTLTRKWSPTDGGGAMAGTNYSLRTLFPEDRERDQQRKSQFESSVFFAPEQRKDEGSFISNGLSWEHVLIYEYTRYPKNRATGPNPSPGLARINRLRDVYIYKHPEGWWLRAQGSFHIGMLDYPEVLASRRSTLRQVVESIKIEPKDPARVN